MAGYYQLLFLGHLDGEWVGIIAIDEPPMQDVLKRRHTLQIHFFIKISYFDSISDINVFEKVIIHLLRKGKSTDLVTCSILQFVILVTIFASKFLQYLEL